MTAPVENERRARATGPQITQTLCRQWFGEPSCAAVQFGTKSAIGRPRPKRRLKRGPRTLWRYACSVFDVPDGLSKHGWSADVPARPQVPEPSRAFQRRSGAFRRRPRAFRSVPETSQSLPERSGDVPEPSGAWWDASDKLTKTMKIEAAVQGGLRNHCLHNVCVV